MCKTIKQKVKFKLSPNQIYELLTDAKQHADLTGETATISQHVGGAFTILGGRITGINVDLVPGQRVVQAWRKTYWEKIRALKTDAIKATRTR